MSECNHSEMVAKLDRAWAVLRQVAAAAGHHFNDGIIHMMADRRGNFTVPCQMCLAVKEVKAITEAK